MTRTGLSILLGCICVIVSSCSGDDGTRTRYGYERRAYDAWQAELRVFDLYPHDDFSAWQDAVAEYESVLSVNPLSADTAMTQWSTGVYADIRRVTLSAQIGLLRLWFFDLRQHASVTNDDYWFEPRELLQHLPEATPFLDVDRLYPHPDRQRARNMSDYLIKQIAADSVFWSDVVYAQDTVLAVPLALIDRDVTAELSSRAAFADSFYSEVVARWPDSPAARKALAYKAAARGMAGDWGGAVATLDSLLSLNRRVWGRDELLVMKGDALAFGLGFIDSAAVAYRNALQHPTSDDTRWAAELRLALLAATERDGVSATDEALKRCHLAPRAPEWAAAWALWARARFLGSRGRTDQAVDLLWRLIQRHTFTLPAALAPIAIARVMQERASAPEIQSGYEKSLEFYDELMARPSYALSPKYFVLDCVFELRRVVRESGVTPGELDGSRWIADFRDIASYKQAIVARDAGGVSKEHYKRLLKAMERSATARYARAIEQILDALPADASLEQP